MPKNLALLMAKNLALSLRKWHKKNLIGENGGERKINPSANPGRGGNQGVARLVMTGCGIAVSEIFGAIREDSRCCVYVRISAPQIASNRFLSLMDAKVLFA